MLIPGNTSSQRAADQLFPFVIFPRFFLAGVFNPIQILPLYPDVLSRISPMRYAVDLARSVVYTGREDEFAAFLVVGAALFIRREKSRQA